MKVYFAADHAGFELKNTLVAFVRDELRHEAEDLGAHEFNPDDDYPDFISRVAERVSAEPETTRGIVLGGSGQGEAMVANKFPGVRAVVYYGEPWVSEVDARSEGERSIIALSRTHNDSNVLALGARFLDESEAKAAVKLWLETAFSGEERHVRRLRTLASIDANTRIATNAANDSRPRRGSGSSTLVYPDLSYTITGICFEVHNALGRFSREKQYSDALEQKLRESDILYKREHRLADIGDIVDFLIDDKIILEVKAKRLILKDDLYQVQRYLKHGGKKLGMLVNFRNRYLKPIRVLNSEIAVVH